MCVKFEIQLKTPEIHHHRNQYAPNHGKLLCPYQTMFSIHSTLHDTSFSNFHSFQTFSHLFLFNQTTSISTIPKNKSQKNTNLQIKSTLPSQSTFAYSSTTATLASKPAIASKVRGTGTAIVTPFKGVNANELDIEGLQNLVDSQITGGIDFIVPVGTTGECPTLSHKEHELVIKTVVDRVAGRIPVVAGTGSNNTTEAISLTQFAKDCGADAALIVNPYYNKPSQNGLFLHFQAIAAAVDLPIVLYNIPSRCGITMQPETVAKLWNEIPNIIAIKEATGSLDIASKIRALCPIPIVSGDDTLTLPLMSIGGCGVISVLSNVAPKLVKSIVDEANAGNWKAAADNHCRLHKLMGTMFIDTNPVPVKEAAQVMGIIGSSAVRLPMAPIEPAKREILMAVLKEYKLIE